MTVIKSSHEGPGIPILLRVNWLCKATLGSGAQLFGLPLIFLVSRWTLCPRFQIYATESFSNNASLSPTWICRFLFLHGSCSDVLLVPAQMLQAVSWLRDTSENSQWGLCLFFSSFYSELNKIRGWNMLKEEGYLQPRSHWQSGSCKDTAGACLCVASG